MKIRFHNSLAFDFTSWSHLYFFVALYMYILYYFYLFVIQKCYWTLIIWGQLWWRVGFNILNTFIWAALAGNIVVCFCILIGWRKKAVLKVRAQWYFTTIKSNNNTFLTVQMSSQKYIFYRCKNYLIYCSKKFCGTNL